MEFLIVAGALILRYRALRIEIGIADATKQSQTVVQLILHAEPKAHRETMFPDIIRVRKRVVSAIFIFCIRMLCMNAIVCSEQSARGVQAYRPFALTC